MQIAERRGGARGAHAVEAEWRMERSEVVGRIFEIYNKRYFQLFRYKLKWQGSPAGCKNQLPLPLDGPTVAAPALVAYRLPP